MRFPGLEGVGQQVARRADESAVLLHGPVEDRRLVHQLERLVSANEVGAARVKRLDVAGDSDHQDEFLVLCGRRRHRYGPPRAKTTLEG